MVDQDEIELATYVPDRPRRAIVEELAELIRQHVRPEWRQEILDRLPKFGQMELFR